MRGGLVHHTIIIPAALSVPLLQGAAVCRVPTIYQNVLFCTRISNFFQSPIFSSVRFVELVFFEQKCSSTGNFFLRIMSRWEHWGEVCEIFGTFFGVFKSVNPVFSDGQDVEYDRDTMHVDSRVWLASTRTYITFAVPFMVWIHSRLGVWVQLIERQQQQQQPLAHIFCTKQTVQSEKILHRK